MIFRKLMRIDSLLIIISLCIVFLVACSTIDPKSTQNSCILFEEKKSWYKATKKSYDKWEVPIALQLSIINQESSFKQFAKPKRSRLFGFIPGRRLSTAFGYAQIINPTWEWYKTSTGNSNASRANFYDVTDFIGWYSLQTKKILGISNKDFYNQYLAYHEGHGGWEKKSYKSKEWLLDVAKRVETNADKYNNQLKDCESKLNKKGFFGVF